MDEQRIVSEFIHQSEAFFRSPAMNAPETLDAFVAWLPARPVEICLDVACGPGIVARALARRVRSVLGVDLTPAMVDLARREAGGAGIRFEVGDATALRWGPDSFWRKPA